MVFFFSLITWIKKNNHPYRTVSYLNLWNNQIGQDGCHELIKLLESPYNALDTLMLEMDDFGSNPGADTDGFSDRVNEVRHLR